MRYMCVAGVERMEHTHRTNKTKVSKTRTAVLDGEVERKDDKSRKSKLILFGG